MFNEERRRLILAQLYKHETVHVNYLSTLFSVSKETIRNDLNVLAKSGRVQRCYGGAIISDRTVHAEDINNFDARIIDFFKKIKPNKDKKTRKEGKKMNGKVCILGSFNVDIIANVARFPKGGESILSTDSIIGPGGKGANQALAASKSLADVHFIAKVGKDQFGQLASDHLLSSNMKSVTLYQDEEAKTGSALIYVSQLDGENMIAIYPGANQSITEEEVFAITPELSNSDVFLTQLENNFSATLQAIKIAQQLDAKVMLNPAPYSPNALQCLPYVDFITPNETEASQLSGIEVTDLTSAKQAAEQIKNQGAKNVIITMGAKGALIFDGQKHEHIPAFKAVCVDSTGAGDAFNGAFAAAIARGETVVQAAKFASAFASLAVEKVGASNMPDYESALSRISQNNGK
ncbi:TPA: ribokinase [Serratia fonticola]